jgi:anti-sigma factor RsiW
MRRKKRSRKRSILMRSGHIRELDLIAYLDGDRSIAAQVEEHLLVCEECRARLNALREFDIALYTFLTGEDIHGKIERLLAQIDEDGELIAEAIAIMHREAARKGPAPNAGEDLERVKDE